MTDREKAELRRMEAETNRIYLQEGVLFPEEVARANALNRYWDHSAIIVSFAHYQTK